MDTLSITLALYSVLLVYLNLVMIRCFSEGGGGGMIRCFSEGGCGKHITKKVPIIYVCNYFSFITLPHGYLHVCILKNNFTPRHL